MFFVCLFSVCVCAQVHVRTEVRMQLEEVTPQALRLGKHP